MNGSVEWNSRGYENRPALSAGTMFAESQKVSEHPRCRYGAVGEPLDRRQTWNSVPDIDQPAARPIGSQLSKLFFASELLAPLVGDFGRRAVSSDVVFRVDGEDRH